MLKRYSFDVLFLATAVVLTAVLVPAPARAQSHPMMTPAEVKWGPAPPALPPGAQLAVLDGDPGKAGPFALRLKLPDGYKVAPHWHPTDEHITVIQGTFGLGMGNALNAASAKMMPAGSYAKMPAEMRHYAIAKGETIVQVSGQGPFVVNYVNPKDDPSKKQ